MIGRATGAPYFLRAMFSAITARMTMIAQMATVALLLCVSSSAALAQRDRALRFPAEKFSTRPVQPQMNVAPVARDIRPLGDEQKRRWEERSRNPTAPPR
jgi:hypothetical protein